MATVEGRIITPAQEIRNKIQEIKIKLQEGFFDLGPLLHEVWKEKYWQEWGYHSWQEAVEKEVGISYRVAQYLISIWVWCAYKKNSPELYNKLKEIGWTKAKELAGFITPENADEWIKRAKESTAIKLAMDVRTLAKPPAQGEEESREPLSRYLTVKLSDSMYQNVLLAIQRAGELIGSDEDKAIGHKIDLICSDFLATNSFMSSGRENMVFFFQKFESLLGIKLIAVDTKEKRIIWGSELIDQLNQEDKNG